MVPTQIQTWQMTGPGKLALEPFVEIRPMSGIEHAFDEAHHGRHTKRVILTPDF